MSMSKTEDEEHAPSSRGIFIMPRVLRLRDAPRYLGMNRNLFNDEVRLYLTTIPIGQQGVAFDRLELDAWWEQYKSRNGRPAARRIKPLDKRKDGYPASLSGAVFGTLTRKSEVADFAKALAKTTSGKRRSI